MSCQLMKGSCMMIPSLLRDKYLECPHKRYLSASKVQKNGHQYLYWPGIEDYMRRCHKCIKRSSPANKPLKPCDIPDQPWQKIATDFNPEVKQCLLICDYFSQFSYMYILKKSTSFCFLCIHLMNGLILDRRQSG